MARKGLALVTGGSTGIGRRLAQCAARDGCHLIILSDDDDVADMPGLAGTGVAIETTRFDLSQQAEVKRLLELLSAGRPICFSPLLATGSVIPLSNRTLRI